MKHMKKRVEIINDSEYTVCIDGRLGASVCGTLAILDYSDTVIRLLLKKCILSIKGQGLSLKSYYPDDIEIKGLVSSVEFEESRSKEAD